MSFSNLLANKKFTQKDLALKIGVSQPCVSKWLNNINQPNLQTMQKMAEILNVDLQTIVNCFVKDKEKTKKE